jgi:hypothetical protein
MQMAGSSEAEGPKKTANKYQLQLANNEVHDVRNKRSGDETEHNVATVKRRRLLHRYVYHMVTTGLQARQHSTWPTQLCPTAAFLHHTWL